MLALQIAGNIGGHLRGRRCKDGISVQISYPFLVLIQAAVPRSEVVQSFEDHSTDITGQYRGRLLKFSTRSFKVLGIRYFLPKRFVLYLPIIPVNIYGAYPTHDRTKRTVSKIPNTYYFDLEDKVH